MRSFKSKFQIGKQGLTPGVINSLKLSVKNHKQVRISLLKALGRDKTKVKEIVEALKKHLNVKCKYTIIGFTIIISNISSQSKVGVNAKERKKKGNCIFIPKK